VYLVGVGVDGCRVTDAAVLASMLPTRPERG
jgi:hypothetical protein